MKFHFICEGAKGKAEHTFIQHVIDTYHNGEAYEIYNAEGNRGIEPVFYSEVLPVLCAGDIFILFFDNIKVIKDKPTGSMLKRIKRECNSKGVTFRHTTYYCFEELFLSYSGLIDILNIDSQTSLNLIQLQEALMQKSYPKDVSFWYTFIGGQNGTLTRETLSSAVLSVLTNKAHKGFKITKSSIGDCWCLDCNDTTLNKNVCNRCAFCMRGTKFKDKLDDLLANSVAKFGLPFSTIFDT